MYPCFDCVSTMRMHALAALVHIASDVREKMVGLSLEMNGQCKRICR